MSAALSLTEGQLEEIIARAAKAGAREALALVTPAPRGRERATRVASAKAAAFVAAKNRKQR